MTYTESSNPINISGLIITVLFSTVISGILIGIVGLLSLDLAVDDIDAAFLAGLSIAVTGGYSLTAHRGHWSFGFVRQSYAYKRGDCYALVRVLQKQVNSGDFQ